MFVREKKYRELQEAYKLSCDREMALMTAKHEEIASLRVENEIIAGKLIDALEDIEFYKQKYIDELQKRLALAEIVERFEKQSEGETV